MLVPILIAVAVVFLILGFLHAIGLVVGLVVGLAVAVVCAVIAVAVALGGGSYRRRV